jgi:hypothetical protein
MRHFMICFAGFVKSVRSNSVFREKRLLGSFSVYVSCVHVMLLVYFVLLMVEPGVLDSVT